ncbi:MAG: NAD(P)-binding domain-containing protein [Halanaerobiales bacterium]|nr:NAD(P)-binding domain-containing protein [Halanaerobiales bacterium]
MNSDKMYDVIIVGGGPAGLSVGSELSKELKVLVIEQGEIRNTRKSWFDPKDVVEKNEDIVQFTYGGVRRFLTNTYTGTPFSWKVKLFDRYPYIKEKEILKYWKDVILKNNSDVMENCQFENHLVEDDIVTVETLQGKFKGKLLIDASGYDSLILKKYEIEPKQYYWWSVYGYIGKHPGGVKNMEVGDYMLWQTFEDTNVDKNASLRNGRPVFEYEILDKDTSFTLILYLRKDKMPLDFMKKEFEHIIRKEDSTKNFHNIEVEEVKYGYYPSGGLTQRVARDRVDFIGDAGCWTTPCGWGMGFILNNYKQYSKSLIKLFKEDKLDQHSLYSLVDMETYDKSQILLNQLITHFLSNANATMLDKFIGLFKIIDPLICEKIFTLKVTPKEIRKVLKIVWKTFEVEELIKVIPKEDYLKVMELAEFSIITYIKDLVYRLFHGGKLPTRTLGDGFDIEA